MIIDGIEIPDEKLISEGWKPPVKRGRQRVAKGCHYFFIDGSGAIVLHKEIGSYKNSVHFHRGNYFHTKEAAEHNEDVRCAGVRIIDALREAEGDCEAVDCSKTPLTQTWFIVFRDRNDNSLGCVETHYQQAPPEWYTTKEDTWHKVIKSHEADLRLWFGI